MASLGSLVLLDDSVWINEWEWSPVDLKIERSLTGAAIINEAVKTGGRPVDLDVGRLTRQQLLALKALADVPKATYSLSIALGTYTVRFNRPPYTVTPLREIADPDSTEPYHVIVHLLQG